MDAQTSLFSLPLDKPKTIQSSKKVIENIPKAYEDQANTPDTITALLNTLFPEQQREGKEIKQAKAILSTLSTTLSAEELQVVIYEVQYLVTCWTDLYERKIFKDMTLKELLNEG